MLQRVTLKSLTIIGTGKNYDPTSDTKDHEEFNKWLQCYNKPDMDSMADHNKRMIWFKVSFCYIIITCRLLRWW